MSFRRCVGDYALIGDGESAALVGRDAAVEWLCWPRFDSPACFAALLGDARNGRWTMAPESLSGPPTRRYRPDAMILETRFETATGAARVIDFMPIREQRSDMVRIVEGLDGEVEMHTAFALRFDHGRLPPWRRWEDGAHRFVCGPHACRLMADVDLNPAQDEEDRLVGSFRIAAGERRSFALTYHPSLADPPPCIEPDRALRETEEWWREWASRCTYEGPWREAVMRSLLTMKALANRPTGGIVAAPTSSLPEIPGGDFNWDYRFCWLRDATFTLLAFLTGGYPEEGQAWRDWLLRAAAGHPAQLQPVYGIEGEQRLTEWNADWLSGFEGAQPVRFGNGAFEQRQLDVFGEVMDAIHQARMHGAEPPPDAWNLQRRLVEHVEEVWREPDAGIWESRGEPEFFTFSRAMAWVALDRGVRSVERFGLDGPVERWRRVREEIHAEVCERGFDRDLGSFTRAYGNRELDGSLLLLPAIGFLPATDPRILGTIDAIREKMTVDGFVYRHPPKPGGEASFLVCSFWLCDALILAGRREEAAALFERLLDVRNDLGLMSEEYEPRERRLVGNFPQALSHLGLVNTAYNLLERKGPSRKRGEER